MENKLASAVTLYTPLRPVSHAQATAIRQKVEDALAKLAEEVTEILLAGGDAIALSGDQEEVVIITTPPPR